MAPYDDLSRDVDRYLSHFGRAGKRPTFAFSPHSHNGPVWTPAVDMFETDSGVVVRLELPGVDATQTEVHAEPGRLLIRGVRHERPVPDEHRTYHALEIAYGRFERILRLPPGLDTQAAEASYRDGLLEIVLPRRAPHQVRVSVQPHDEDEARQTP